MKTSAVFGIAFLLAAALMVSCGEKSAGNVTSANPPPEQPTTTSPPANGTSTKPPANVGGLATIKGKIKFTGDAPGPEKKPINKDPQVCGKGQRDIHWYRVNGGLLDETVVFLDGEYEGASWDGSEATTQLVQEGCFFKPYIDIWQKGKEVKIISKDSAAHNIHTYERIGMARRELFNFNQPKKDVRTVVIKPRRSQFVELTCDNHDFMAGWRFVAKNPYCTIAQGGTFTLKVPAGSHTVKVWHPMMGVQEQEIEVKAGEEKTVDFEFEYEEE